MGDEMSCLYSNPNLEFDDLYIAFMKFKKLEDCIGCNGEKECNKKILAYNSRKELLITDEIELHLNYIKSLSSLTANP